MNKTHSIDMINGPLLKNIILFAVPLMFTNFLQILFNAADTIVVGKFAGETALAAVGATGSIVFLITSLFNGLSTGSNVVIARYIGLKKDDLTSKAVHTSIVMALGGGILLTVIGVVFAKTFLLAMSTPDDIVDLSNLYMQIYFCGSLFLLVYDFGAAVLRSKGDTQRPLYYLFAGGILNVVLNLIFVIVFQMSVAGVAIATVVSQAVSAGLVMMTLLREEDATRIDIHQLKLDNTIAWDILKIGFPAGIQGVVFSLSNVVIQSNINSFDSSTIVAANSAAANIENFTYIGTMAFTQATITFTSQNIGAGKKEAVLKIMLVTLALTVSSSFLIGVLVYGFGDTFLGFYTNDAIVRGYGMIRLKYVVLWLFLNGILDVFVCSMRGMGISTLPTVLMIIGICGVRLVWLYFAFPYYHTLESIYICFPISWLFTSVIQFVLWLWVYKKNIKMI